MFARQLHNPLLLVLLVTAAVLRAVGDLTGTLTIGAIMA